MLFGVLFGCVWVRVIAFDRCWVFVIVLIWCVLIVWLLRLFVACVICVFVPLGIVFGLVSNVFDSFLIDVFVLFLFAGFYACLIVVIGFRLYLIALFRYFLCLVVFNCCFCLSLVVVDSCWWFGFMFGCLWLFLIGVSCVLIVLVVFIARFVYF